MILKKILKLAEKNNISISCLEKTLGFGNGTIKKWGESSPSVDKLKKVADYFGVSVDYRGIGRALKVCSCDAWNTESRWIRTVSGSGKDAVEE